MSPLSMLVNMIIQQLYQVAWQINLTFKVKQRTYH